MRCKISNYNNSELTLFVCLLAIKTIKYAISFQKKKEKKKFHQMLLSNTKHICSLYYLIYKWHMSSVIHAFTLLDNVSGQIK